MTESFRKFRCWKTAEVQRTIFSDIGSLRTQDDAIFLAAHAPVPLRREVGPAAAGDGESEILHALEDEIGIAGRNTLIAVTGEVGTGKSHAVRWVRAHLAEDPLRYRIIYVPRDLSTLRGLLDRILDGMPGEKARIAKRHLDDAFGRKPESQMREELIDNLRQALAFELPDQGSGDRALHDTDQRSFLLGKRENRNSRRRDGLADILLNLRVIEHFSRDGGTVAAVIRWLQAKRVGGDEELPQFTAEDLPTRAAGILNHLDPDARIVWNSLRGDPVPAVAILNEALRRAVPMTLGIGSGITLEDVFLEARELLRREDAELVLLFEDLALFGLMDGDLYDQFALQPGETYCPLRVIFAITTYKYDSVPDTVQDRITHHYVVQNLSSEQADHTDPSMVAFVARYLNNARVGRDALIASRSAADEHAREIGAWVPNACEIRENGQPCRHRDECFDAFGSADVGPGGPVGLYPHNEVSLRRASRHLREAGRLSPRWLIKDTVETFLTTAEPEIAAGIFPTEEIENWLYLGVDRAREAIVPETGPLSLDERERLRRARIAWADGETERPGVHVAFDLPGDIPALADQPLPHAGRTGPVPATTSALTSTPEPTPPSRSSDHAQSLYDWESKVTRLPVDEMEEFRRLFHRWTKDRLDLGRHLVHASSGTGEAVLISVFPEMSFVIKGASGATPAAGRLQFDIPRSPVGLRLLLAARWFAQHGHWDPADASPGWEFPRGFRSADLQVDLENWLSSCAAAVEKQFLHSISSSGGTRPAAAVVTLRAAALRVLGRLDGDETARTVDAAAADPGQIAGSWSSAWQELAKAATDVISSLSPGLIAEFAAARQGDTGEPIVIDAAALEPAGLAAISDPAAAVIRLGEFSDRLGAINQARARLTIDWAGIITSERHELLAELHYLEAAASPTEPDIASRADELGTRANADRVFRPERTYLDFRQAIETLRSCPHDAVSDWIGSGAALGDPDNRAAVFDAQSWAAQARSYAQSLGVVLAAMTATAEFLDERLTRHAGESPDALANRVADQLDNAGAQLERLGQGCPS